MKTNVNKSQNISASYCGRDVVLYPLKSDELEIGVTDLGACIEYLRFKDNNGAMRELCLHFNSPTQRINSGTYCGAVIGRVANRIAGAEFQLNGTKYKLAANEGNNTLHGGAIGFDQKFFSVNCYDNTAVMKLISEDGDQGFPAHISLTVTYQVIGNSVLVEFTAVNVSDVDTVWAPTLHSYFNLNMRRDILDTYLKINADYYTPVDEHLIPTGEVVAVKGTPFDFTDLKKIGKDIDCEHPQLLIAKGYDHNFVLNSEHAATAQCDGIQLDIFTDMPGLQFYSGNYLSVSANCDYCAREGFALEPQFFPNAVNDPKFEKPILKARETKKHYIKYTFSRI